MTVSSNEHCPLPCMVCEGQTDKSQMWKCPWCCLRICESCYKGLESCKNRNLGEFLGKRIAVQAGGQKDPKAVAESQSIGKVVEIESLAP